MESMNCRNMHVWNGRASEYRFNYTVKSLKGVLPAYCARHFCLTKTIGASANNAAASPPATFWRLSILARLNLGF